MNKVAACAAARMYACVGVGQYWAVQRAEHDRDRDGEDERGGRSRSASDRGAVAGASAAVLSYLFPAQAQSLEDMVMAQRGAGTARAQRGFARGEAISGHSVLSPDDEVVAPTRRFATCVLTASRGTAPTAPSAPAESP